MSKTLPSESDEERAVARAIRTFVFCTLPITFVWAICYAFVAPQVAVRSLSEAAAFMGIGISALRLVALSRTRLAATLMSSVFWLVVAWSSYLHGGVHAHSFAAFSAMILMTGVLWSTRAAFVMTGLTIALGALFVWLDARALLPASQPSSPLMTLVASCLIFGTVATLQYLSSRAARENLSRALTENFQRKLAELESVQITRALESSERRYRHIFESAAVALFEIDFSQFIAWREQWLQSNAGKDLHAEIERDPALVEEIGSLVSILDANDEALRMLELSEKRMLLGNLTPRFRADARKSAVEVTLALTDMADGPHVVQRELSVRTFRGRKRRVLLSGRSPVSPARRDRLVVSAVDLTEQRIREERTRAMQRLEAIGRLAGGVAHDFNNALVVIISWANMLRRPGRTEAERAEGLDAIAKSAARAGELVRRLLSMGRREVRAPRPTRIGSVIDDTVRGLSRLLPEDISIVVEPGPDVQVMVDESQLQQVLLNLALNARDAMPQGGKLEIRTRLCANEEVADLDPSPEPYVEVAVSDTGIGMDRQTQERIFEPFFSTKGEGHGTGLGLATAHAVIAESRGKIVVESAPGQGARFRIFLPSAEQRLPSPPPMAAKSLDGRGRTVLVVEDEELVRGVLVETLVTAGYHVLEAGEGAVALKLARAHGGRIDLLCTDGILPGMATRDLIGAFLALFPHAPVLICSGHVQEELMRRSIARGDFAFLPKPFPPEELVRRVEELLAGASPNFS